MGWQNRCKLCAPGRASPAGRRSSGTARHLRLAQAIRTSSSPSTHRASPRRSPEPPRPARRRDQRRLSGHRHPRSSALGSGAHGQTQRPGPRPSLPHSCCLVSQEHRQRPAARTREPDEGRSRSRPPPAPCRPLAGGCCRDATARHLVPSPSVASRSRARPHLSPPPRAASGGIGGASSPAPAQRARQRWDGRAHAVLPGRAGPGVRERPWPWGQAGL